jgi:TPR repeat protein
METMKNISIASLVVILFLCIPHVGVAGQIEDADAALKRQDYATALKLLRPLADKGDAMAEFDLGFIYEDGKGVPQNCTEAAKWFHKVVEQGFSEAQYYLGLAYYCGGDAKKDAPHDYAEAMKSFRKAADYGSTDAMSMIGFMYEMGNGVQQNYSESVKWYRKAAEQGDRGAQGSLGGMYERGDGVLQDYVQAYMWYNLGAASSDGTARLNAMIRKDLAAKMTAAQIAEGQKLANEWNAQHLSPQQKNVGADVADKTKTPDNNSLVDLAAQQSKTPQSPDLVTQQFNDGLAAEKRGDYLTALQLWRPLADQGIALAQINLGFMYSKGEGVVQNDVEAVKLFQRAADKGNAEAQGLLGVSYARGLGVPKDAAEASKWFHKAAANGDVVSQSYLNGTYRSSHGSSQGSGDTELQEQRMQLDQQRRQMEQKQQELEQKQQQMEIRQMEMNSKIDADEGANAIQDSINRAHEMNSEH